MSPFKEFLSFQDQAVAFEELKKTMETTRAHLQNQLRSKEMECGRLSVQIRVRNNHRSSYKNVEQRN